MRTFDFYVAGLAMTYDLSFKLWLMSYLSPYLISMDGFDQWFCEQISVEDVMKAIHLKSFDYRVLNLLLYQLRDEKVYLIRKKWSLVSLTFCFD